MKGSPQTTHDQPTGGDNSGLKGKWGERESERAREGDQRMKKNE